MVAHKILFVLMAIRRLYAVLRGEGILRVLQEVMCVSIQFYLHLACMHCMNYYEGYARNNVRQRGEYSCVRERLFISLYSEP